MVLVSEISGENGNNKLNYEMATPRGFEPLISTVTGWHVKPLHHGALFDL